MNSARACALVLLAILSFRPSMGRAQTPATAEHAAAVLNLEAFPMVEGALKENYRMLAGQSYAVPASVTNVAEQIRERLKKDGFEELQGAVVTDAYATCNFRKQGFLVSLMVTPSGMPDHVQVILTNHGNVELGQIPVPEGTATLYTFPASVAFITERSVEETSQAMRDALGRAGWVPFGETTVSFFMKQNAVRLQVMVMAAPAQQGKTMIQITSEQMSIDLPAPADAENLQYTDGTGGLFFDAPRPQSEVVMFFKEELGKRGWAATTENPVQIGFRDHLIFRNPEMEMIEIEFSDFDGKTRSQLRYQTASQVEASEARADAQMATLKAVQEEAAATATLTIELPKGVKVTEEKPTSLTFTAESGKARETLKEWLKSYEKAGWKAERTIDEAAVGNYTLTKDSQRFEVVYVDPGVVLPAEVTIRASGALKLSVKKE